MRSESKKRHVDGQTRQRRVFPLAYNYNREKVFVCLFVCLYVLYSRELGWTDRDKPYIFRILRVPRASSRNFFPIIPVLKGIMGRFVRVGGRHALVPIVKVVSLQCKKNDTWTNRPGSAGSFR